MYADSSLKTQTGVGHSAEGMRSPRGFWGSLVVLVLLPLTFLYQMLFASGSDTFVHWVLALGAALMAWAVFDFSKTPKWTQWIGCLSVLVLAIVFFLQGTSHLLQNASFTYLAYDVLGGWVEGWSFRLFLYIWGVAVLLLDSQGTTRTLGVIAVFVFLSMEIYRFGISNFGFPPIAWLRAVYLVPFVWLLLESWKAQSQS